MASCCNLRSDVTLSFQCLTLRLGAGLLPSEHRHPSIVRRPLTIAAAWQE